MTAVKMNLCSFSDYFTKQKINTEEGIQKNAAAMFPGIGFVLVFSTGLAFAVLYSLLPVFPFGDRTGPGFSTKSKADTSGKAELRLTEGGVARTYRYRTASSLRNLCAPQFVVHDALASELNQEYSDAKEGIILQKKMLDTKAGSARTHVKAMSGEAQSAMHLAREMAAQGKVEKARKLYQHAMALDHHPDVLTEYGEFLEQKHEDILQAEHLYCRALAYNPSHDRALMNRKRTLPLVEEIDQTSFNRIEKKREIFFQIPESHPGLRRLKQESYLKHLYHTTAIEGNTFSLSETKVVLQHRVAIGGKSIVEHNEILGVDAALKYVNTTLLKRIGAIKVSDILDIHKRVLGFVDPVGAGQLRTTQVFVGDYVPPPPSDISDMMEEFITWLNSEDALHLNPIELAALAHYRLVFIHPFYDGNGRTSRMLMNLILMQAGYPPVTIKVEEKHEYYQYLETANSGDVRPFIRFIAKCTERTLDEYLWAMSDRKGYTFPSLDAPKNDGRTIFIDEDGS